MDINTPPTVKLNPKAILKMLPKGFVGVSIPNKTRVVFLKADANIISKDNATKAINKLCKDLKLKIDYENAYESSIEYCLIDPVFNKSMYAEAKACLKAVKSFYSKYRIACRYDDTAGNIARQVLRIVTNSEC